MDDLFKNPDLSSWEQQIRDSQQQRQQLRNFQQQQQQQQQHTTSSAADSPLFPSSASNLSSTLATPGPHTPITASRPMSITGGYSLGPIAVGSGQNPLIMKVHYGSDIRRLQVFPHDLSYNDLVLKLQRVFGIDPSAEVTLKYHDEDGDLITMIDDTDLHLATLASETIRLTVYVNGVSPDAVSHKDIQQMKKQFDALTEAFSNFLVKLDSMNLSHHSAKAPPALDADSLSDVVEKMALSPGPSTTPSGTATTHSEFDPIKPSKATPAITKPQQQMSAQSSSSNTTSSTAPTMQGTAMSGSSAMAAMHMPTPPHSQPQQQQSTSSVGSYGGTQHQQQQQGPYAYGQPQQQSFATSYAPAFGNTQTQQQQQQQQQQQRFSTQQQQQYSHQQPQAGQQFYNGQQNYYPQNQ